MKTTNDKPLGVAHLNCEGHECEECRSYRKGHDICTSCPHRYSFSTGLVCRFEPEEPEAEVEGMLEPDGSFRLTGVALVGAHTDEGRHSPCQD